VAIPASSLNPATTLGVFLILHLVFAGSIRSGAAAYKSFDLFILLIVASITSLNVPGYEVDSLMIKAPYAATSPTCFAADLR